MIRDFVNGLVSYVLCLFGYDVDWVLVYVIVNWIEFELDIFVGLVVLWLFIDEEFVDVGLLKVIDVIIW